MSFLRKRVQAPKATISVTLDKAAYNLREPITGMLDVSSSEEVEVDELRIELWVTEWTTAREQKGGGGRFGGGGGQTVQATQNATLHKGKVTISGRMKMTEDFNQQFPFSMPLPPGIPPTYRGRNANNTWKLKGVIAVKGRPDVVGHEMEVLVNP